MSAPSQPKKRKRESFYFPYRMGTSERVKERTILKNASTIRVIDCENGLPLNPAKRVVYKNLRKLTCSKLSPEAASACPVLQELRFTHRDPSGNNYIEKNDRTVDAISKLVTLKSFSFTGYGVRSPFVFERVLDHLNLREIELSQTWDEGVNPPFIKKLVKNSPGLRSLSISLITLTDTSLASLAELHYLEKVTLNRVRGYTAAGIVTLMRGNSRHRLRRLSVQHDDDSIAHAVKEEADKIRAEKQGMMYLPATASPELVLTFQ